MLTGLDFGMRGVIEAVVASNASVEFAAGRPAGRVQGAASNRWVSAAQIRTRCGAPNGPSRSSPGVGPDPPQARAQHEVQGLGRQADETLTGVMDHPSKLGEDRETESLRAGAAVL